MPEFGYALPDRPALDEFARTDLLLDALAQRERVDSDDPDDDALAALLEDWRDELRWPPASALVSPEQAVEALHTGLADLGSGRRGRRGLAVIGSVAATLLVLSGFGAVWSRPVPEMLCTACTRCSSTSRGSTTIRSCCPPKQIWRRCRR